MDTQQKKQYLNFWNWTFAVVFLLGIVCGSILIYRLWSRSQQLEKLKTKLTELKRKGQVIK